MTDRSSRPRGSSRPLNVEQIVQEAKNFDFNPHIPLKYWLRSAGTLLKEVSLFLDIFPGCGFDCTQAEIYESEGNQQQTYLLLFRHAELVINHLATHPDAVSPEEKAGLLQAEKDVGTSLTKLDRLKPQINKRYERYEKLAKERAAEGATAGNRQPFSVTREEWRFGERGRRPSMDPGGTQSLAADENKDLAVKLARSEIKRRAIARKATRQAGIPEEVEQERRTAGLWGNWEEAFTNDETDIDRDTLSRQMQSVRMQVDGKKDSTDISQRESRLRPSALRSQYSYPTVPIQNQRHDGVVDTRTMPEQPEHPLSLAEPPRRPPTPPPKDDLSSRGAPPKPAKTPISDNELASMRDQSPAPSDLKPSTFTFKPSAFLENGNPLRTIFLPPELRHKFLKIAEPNTRKNLETCGILCGTLISNALFISKLVIPEQKSTSDTCETVNENKLFDYVDGEDLMMLGWIHTHPTQTCFMSSRDLHTHCGYQVMMPESIAIVCAPTKNPE